MTRVARIRAKREALVLQADLLRGELGYALDPWRKPLRYVDLGWGVVRALKRKPLWIILISAGVLGLRAQRVGKWAVKTWSVWKIFGLFRQARRS
ncbi:MAG: YqjK family protein [Betaproteobacteria bacterium]|nr:YqjK family protein [Betaproteobacteria bacterium]